MKPYLRVIIIILSWFLVLSANTIRVPQDQPGIQAGINAAFPGDTVLVADSTYFENIDFKGKAITVASYYLFDGDTTHVDSTIIDGSQPVNPDVGSVVSFVSGEDTNSVIHGFTITGGTGTLYDVTSRVGGGIYCANSGARITHNKIILNTVSHTNECAGGGIGYWPLTNAGARYLIIEENVIESNTITSSNTASYINGGGINIVKGRINGNTIRFNTVSGQPIFAGGGGIAADCEDTATRTLVIISGNTITDNQAATPGTYGGWGGGIDVVFCNVQILDNIIMNNQAGGSQGIGAGVRLWKSKNISILKDNIISFNTASGTSVSGGGGLLYQETSGITIQNNYFEGNTSVLGGGIGEQSSTGGTITGNEFVNNRADTSGGALYSELSSSSISNNLYRENKAKYGGALFTYSGDYQIKDNTFVENDACWGGGIDSYNNSTGNLTSNNFLNNQADSAGGACYINVSNLVLTKNVFKENSAKYGGAILDYSGNYQITNNIIVDNTANWGGGIYNVDNPGQNHEVQIINNTLTRNKADTAGAVFCYNTRVVVMNTICWRNTAQYGSEIVLKGGTLNVAYSDVAWASEGFGGIRFDSTATLNWQTDNIDVDPQFVVDDTLYHLSTTSPCINVGIDSLLMGGVMYYCPPDDYDGDERPYMEIQPDIGADETQVPPAGIEPQPVAGIPKSYALFQNYPNPFNPSTTIEFTLPKSAFVTLKIYNLLGEEVATLVSEKLSAGEYKYLWDASCTGGVASGVYFYRLHAGEFKKTKKLILMK